MRPRGAARGGRARKERVILAKDENKPRDWSKTKAFRELKNSLRDSLRQRGLIEKVYEDKLDEYMDLWVLRQELKADIKARGLTVVDDRGRMSENRCISLSLQTSRQMLTVFTALGFKADEKGLNAGGDDDEL